jgi:hypothetical protein
MTRLRGRDVRLLAIRADNQMGAGRGAGGFALAVDLNLCEHRKVKQVVPTAVYLHACPLKHIIHRSVPSVSLISYVLILAHWYGNVNRFIREFCKEFAATKGNSRPWCQVAPGARAATSLRNSP